MEQPVRLGLTHSALSDRRIRVHLRVPGPDGGDDLLEGSAALGRTQTSGLFLV